MSFHKKNRMRQAGASLMELVVGMGLIGVIAVTGAQVSQQTSRATLATRLQENFNGLATTLSERVRYPEMCAVAMGLAPSIPFTLNPANYATSVQEIALTVPNIKAGPGMNSPIVATGTPIIPLGLMVERLWLSNPVDVTDPAAPVPPPPLPPPNRSFVTMLWLQARGLSSTLNFKTKLLGSMILEVTPAPANLIVGCKTDQAVSYREMCLDLGCVYDDTLPVPCNCPDKPLTACPSWQLPIGVTADGELNCQPWAGLCAPNEIFVGGRLSANAAAPAGSPYCMADPLWEPPVQMPGSTVSFAVAASTGLEDSIHNILINLPAIQSSLVTVTFAVVGGSASRPADYNFPALTVDIPAGSTTGQIPVSIAFDLLADPGETANFQLMSVAGGSGLAIGGITNHTMTIAEAGVVCSFAGTSAGGAGGPAAPAGCNCTVAGQVWDPGTSTCGAVPPMGPINSGCYTNVGPPVQDSTSGGCMGGCVQRGPAFATVRFSVGDIKPPSPSMFSLSNAGAYTITWGGVTCAVTGPSDCSVQVGYGYRTTTATVTVTRNSDGVVVYGPTSIAAETEFIAIGSVCP